MNGVKLLEIYLFHQEEYSEVSNSCNRQWRVVYTVLSYLLPPNNTAMFLSIDQ